MPNSAAIVAYTSPETGQYYVIDFDIITGEDHGISASISTHPVQEGANISDHVRPNLIKLSLKARVTDSPINRVTASGVSPGPLSGEYGPRTIYGSTSKQQTYFNVKGGYPPLTVPNGIPLVSGLSVPTFGFPTPYVPAQVFPGERVNVPNNVSGMMLSFPQKLSRVKNIFGILEVLCLTGVPVEVATDIRFYPRMLINSIGAPRDGSNGLEFSIELQELRTAKTSKTFLTVAAKKKPKEKRAEPAKFEGKKGTPIKLTTRTSGFHIAQDVALGK